MISSDVNESIDDVGLDYVEMYVQDLAAQTALWRDSYGFDEVAVGGSSEQGFRSVVMNQSTMYLVLTEATDARHPAAAYVLAHGDGVADIALRTADVQATLDRAVQCGAELVRAPEKHETGDVVFSATVSGFGDVVHTLVQRRGSGPRLPQGFRELPQTGISETSRRGEPGLRMIDHFAACVEVGQLTPTAEYYKAAFGFREIFEERIAVGSQAMLSKVVRSRTGSVTFTIIQPDPAAEPGQINEFLASHGGAGTQHIAFETDDVIRSVRTMSVNGVEFLSTPDAYYRRLKERVSLTRHTSDSLQEFGILVDEDHGGQLFQIFTRSTSERRTIFFEIIERCGATTFGSANIKALYEAVEMERLSKTVDTRS